MTIPEAHVSSANFSWHEVKKLLPCKTKCEMQQVSFFFAINLHHNIDVCEKQKFHLFWVLVCFTHFVLIWACKSGWNFLATWIHTQTDLWTATQIGNFEDVWVSSLSCCMGLQDWVNSAPLLKQFVSLQKLKVETLPLSQREALHQALSSAGGPAQKAPRKGKSDGFLVEEKS